MNILGEKIKVVCIVGPTAVGKSAFGVRLARDYQGEVISADSMQIYRGMDIGTAKMTPDEMQGVMHHILDVAHPNEPFTVADWVKRANDKILQLTQKRKIPFVVGGTGLYIRAITEDLSFQNQPASLEIRKKWEQYLSQNGTYALYEQLRKIDEQTALRLHPNDTRRVIRAMEIFESTHRPLSAAYHWGPMGGRYDTLQIGLRMRREALYQRVNVRVDQMVQAGLVREVQELLESGISREAQSMQAIGYKELAAYYFHEISLENAIDLVKQATRRFVKRQMSWFMRDPRIYWIELSDSGEISNDAYFQVRMRIDDFLAGIHRDLSE